MVCWDNYVVGSSKVTNNNWKGVFPEDENHEPLPIDSVRLSEPVPTRSINQQTTKEAYQAVLDNASATILKRDAVDLRIIEEVRNGTATHGDGIINSTSDVCGWPELQSKPAPQDTDHDGMPDHWEKKQGLDPNNPATSGYTMLEKYLNSLVDSN